MLQQNQIQNNLKIYLLKNAYIQIIIRYSFSNLYILHLKKKNTNNIVFFMFWYLNILEIK